MFLMKEKSICLFDLNPIFNPLSFFVTFSYKPEFIVTDHIPSYRFKSVPFVFVQIVPFDFKEKGRRTKGISY